MEFTDDDFTGANKNTLCDGRGSLDIIKYLVSKGVMFNYSDLEIAIKYDQLEIVKYFIELKIEIGDYFSWLFIIERKSWKVANYLKTIKLPNFNHLNHFLYMIIQNGYSKINALEAVKYLLDNNLVMYLELDKLEDILNRENILTLKFEYPEIYDYILSKTLL